MATSRLNRRAIWTGLQRALDIFAQNYDALRAGRGPATPVDFAAGY